MLWKRRIRQSLRDHVEFKREKLGERGVLLDRGIHALGRGGVCLGSRRGSFPLPKKGKKEGAP